jgi:hypothetical protein
MDLTILNQEKWMEKWSKMTKLGSELWLFGVI